MLSPNPIFRDPPQGSSRDGGAVMPGSSWASTGSPEGSILKHLFFPVFHPALWSCKACPFSGSGLWLRSPGMLQSLYIKARFKREPTLKVFLQHRNTGKTRARAESCEHADVVGLLLRSHSLGKTADIEIQKVHRLRGMKDRFQRWEMM